MCVTFGVVENEERECMVWLKMRPVADGTAVCTLCFTLG